MKAFNDKMQIPIIAGEFQNLKYLDIFNDNEQNKKMVEGDVANGGSYFRAGYNKIFKALVEALEKKKYK